MYASNTFVDAYVVKKENNVIFFLILTLENILFLKEDGPKLDWVIETCNIEDCNSAIKNGILEITIVALNNSKVKNKYAFKFIYIAYELCYKN